MKSLTRNSFQPALSAGLGLLLALPILSPLLLFAQWPFAPPTTPNAQRNALNAVRMQVDWFQNSTRTAANYGEQGYGNVRQQFEGLRGAYNAFKQTLRPDQLAYGANDLAEMDAGLDILQEAFTNYEQDVANGRMVRSALNDMGQVLRQGSTLWWQELNKKASRLRVGWG
jgi:hypothetical protein